MKTKTLSPRNATTETKICSLQRDNKDFGTDFYIMVNETDVSIGEHPPGEGLNQHIRIPRKYFNRIIDWYNKEQKTRKTV